MKLIVALLISFLISLSTFGQGVTYSPFQPYQVTYVGSGSGSNSTTIIAGSNVTVVTNAANNFTISSSGGGSGIATLGGFGTNTTIYGSTVNNTPFSIVALAGQNSALVQIALGATKLFVIGPDGTLYGNGNGLTNNLGSAYAPLAGPSFTGGISVNGGLLVDSEQATGNIISLGGIFYGNGVGLSNIVGTSSSTNTMISISTNIVLNTVYSNNFGGALNVFIPMTYTVAAVNGNANLSLVVPGFTNYTVGASTTVGVTIAMTYQGVIAGSVPSGSGFYVTNTSTGVGNASTMNGAVWSYATNIVGISLSSYETIQGGSGTSIAQQATGASEYVSLGIPGMAGSTSLNPAKFRLPYSCIYTNLQISNDTGFGVGTNVIATIFTNGVASNMQITWNGAGTAVGVSVSNLTTSLSVPANCYMHINFSNNAALAPANQLLNWNIGVIR